MSFKGPDRSGVFCTHFERQVWRKEEVGYKWCRSQREKAASEVLSLCEPGLQTPGTSERVSDRVLTPSPLGAEGRIRGREWAIHKSQNTLCPKQKYRRLPVTGRCRSPHSFPTLAVIPPLSPSVRYERLRVYGSERVHAELGDPRRYNLCSSSDSPSAPAFFLAASAWETTPPRMSSAPTRVFPPANPLHKKSEGSHFQIFCLHKSNILFCMDISNSWL